MAELQRTLSFPMLLVITINSIMGTGIFFLPAVAAREAGPASILSWIIMGVIAICMSLIFAELASMYPKSGGIYEYTKQAFGTFPSFLFGWITLIAANVTIAMLVVGAIRYLNPALPDIMKIGMSILLVVVFNFMAYRGMQTSAVMLVAFGIITVGTLVLLMVPGSMMFDIGNLQPFFTHPWSGVMLAVFLVAETFFGWETATFLAEETKNPEKNMPRALWMGTLFIVIFCLAFVVISMGSVGWEVFGLEEAPLTYLAGTYFGSRAVPYVSILVYLSIIGSVAGWIVASPRLVMSLAKDKLFIQQFADIHPKHGTPHKAILFQTIVTSLLVVIGSGNYERLLEILVPLVLIMYAGVVIAFIVLRKRKPDDPRPFKLMFGVPLAILSFIAMIGLLVFWTIHDPNAFSILRLGFSFVFVGVPVYLLLTYFYNPDVLIATMNRLAFLNLLFENIITPGHVRERVKAFFTESKEQHLLELGAGVGTLTLLLADLVGKEGKVTALDFSQHNVKIISDRMGKTGNTHVTIIHDSHLINRVHPSVGHVDGVVSVGNFSYFQDIQKMLHDIHDLLPEGGKIYFIEYTDMFWFLPNNPKWLSHPDEIREIFSEAGFSVNVEVQRGLLWKYVHIYGRKGKVDVPYV